MRDMQINNALLVGKNSLQTAWRDKLPAALQMIVKDQLLHNTNEMIKPTQHLYVNCVSFEASMVETVGI